VALTHLVQDAVAHASFQEIASISLTGSSSCSHNIPEGCSASYDDDGCLGPRPASCWWRVCLHFALVARSWLALPVGLSAGLKRALSSYVLLSCTLSTTNCMIWVSGKDRYWCLLWASLSASRVKWERQRSWDSNFHFWSW